MEVKWRLGTFLFSLSIDFQEKLNGYIGPLRLVRIGPSRRLFWAIFRTLARGLR